MYVGMEMTSDGTQIHAAEQDAALRTIRTKLAAEFGGYSVGWVEGGYIANDGMLHQERAIRAEIIADEKERICVVGVARLFKKWFKQESILLNSSLIESNFI